MLGLDISNEMQAAIVTSCVSIAVAIFVLLLTIYFQRRQKRRDVALYMHSQWTSEHTRRMRKTALSYARGHQAAEIDPQEIPEDVADAIGCIRHFCADLHHLIASGNIDVALARALFGSTVITYFDDVFERIDLSRERHNKKAQFYRREVRPLLRYLRRAGG